MRVIVIGAGQVGSTVVEALHAEHQLTVMDLDKKKLEPLAYTFDVAIVEGNGSSRQALGHAEIDRAELVIACTERDEVNLVAGNFARVEAPSATTVIRTADVEYIQLWREGQLDYDFVVCSPLETAHAVERAIGIPAARQTDVFAAGQVQIVEFDIDEHASPSVVGRPLRECAAPVDSKVAGIIRGDSMTLPTGDAVIEPGDRIIVIGSPVAAETWAGLLAPGEEEVRDVVVFGGGRMGRAIASQLVSARTGVRMIEPSPERAREIAEELPGVRVYRATGLDPEFLERERIGLTQAAVFAMREDEKNLYAATLARVHGVQFTIAVAQHKEAREVYEEAGIDVTVDPRQVTAEEIVRFAHDPRTQQVAMIEGDRFEVLDLTTKPDGDYVGLRFADMPIRGALIGAIVRDGKAIFPRGDDVLQAGDRVIVFTESSRVPDVERAL